MASFRVAGFSEVLDWRPMLFQEPIIAQRACVLCGVVYRKAVRLPCLHTLCIKCHALCVEKGGECPVDQQSFCEDDVERLEASLNYILKRKVACWNARSGCSFVGPAASLLDHYKECDFNVVPCCLCHSSVLQSNILEHLKSDCSIRQATGEPTSTPATQDFEDVSRACLEMKTAIGKISEDLLSLQTSLNQCSEDVRVEGARCKAQLEADTSRLTEQLKNHSTVCIARVTEAMQVVVQAATADYKEHVSNELRLLSHCRPKRVHWYIEGWADVKKKELQGGLLSLESPPRAVYGYTISQTIDLDLKNGGDRIGCYMRIHPGKQDLQLEWPFRKVYTVGVIHPKDQSNVISQMVKPGNCKDGFQQCFLRPKEKANFACGTRTLTTAEKLETGGFIQSNTLHLFLEIEP
uniref:Putative activation of mapk involved in innate immune response n=1 Tax=Ixodes ricinus TaxID=34613 RepID=V5IF25_IXORI